MPPNLALKAARDELAGAGLASPHPPRESLALFIRDLSERVARSNVGPKDMPGFQRPPAGLLGASPAVNGLKVIGEVGGMTEAAAKAMWADVQANGRLLASCRGHQFEPLDAPGSRINARWRCSVCTGTVDAHAKHWYMLGRSHGAAHGRGRSPGVMGYPDEGGE